jgi:O-glycosyl hydrolase
MKRLKILGILFALALLFASCPENNTPNPPPNKPPSPPPQGDTAMTADPGGSAINVTFDVNTKYQTIEGFGFFGGMSVYWSSEADLYSDAWAEMVLGDMGLTMWRNELYPFIPVTANSPQPAGKNQDANWPKQERLVKGLVAKAKTLGVDLKIILTIWSPPPIWKTHNSVVGGGGVRPECYNDFADWLVKGLDLYKNEVGVEVYALSFQNEPRFAQPTYNSGTYTGTGYAACLNAIEPIIHAAYPKVKLFGSEDMLEEEAFSWNFDGTLVGATIKAGDKLDVYAVHGYAEGLMSSNVNGAAHAWRTYRSKVPAGKPIWMTETSGFVEEWLVGSGKPWASYFTDDMPGAFVLGQMIGYALKDGHASAWVYWNISENGQRFSGHPHALMGGTDRRKRYYVSKQFYRYIRPGAKMTEVTCADPNLMVIPFSHPEENRFTVMVINDAEVAKKINLRGNELGTNFAMYQTTSANKMDCISVRLNASAPNVIVVPRKSIVTLVNSNYLK